MKSYKYTRSFGPQPKYPRVNAYEPESKEFIVIAGPCSVESKEHIEIMAKTVKRGGATHLRGGVFRAGTYPGMSFGLVSQKTIEAFSAAARAEGLKTVIDVLSYAEGDFARIEEHADCYQIGARAMQNYELLRFIGKHCGNKQVFIKRHPGCSMDELLGAMEHVLAGAESTKASPQICLIERGSSSHMNHVRWDLSISIIPAIHAINPNIPVIVDASHGTGRSDLVASMSLAGIAAGADGALIEVHTNPLCSLSDADQAIEPAEFLELMKKIMLVKQAIGGNHV